MKKSEIRTVQRVTKSVQSAATGFFCGVVMLAASVVNAQPLKDVVEATLKTHPRVLAADAQRRAAAQDVAQARGGYLPTLDVNVGGGRERTSSPDTRALGSDAVSLNRRDT